MSGGEISSAEGRRRGVAAACWLYLTLSLQVLAARLALRLLSLTTTLRLLTPRRRRVADRDPAAAAEDLRAVRMISHYLARDNCLIRALVGLRVLRRHGFDPRLRFGVRKVGEAVLEAHAWLENQDGVRLDKAGDVGGYVPLPPIAEGRR